MHECPYSQSRNTFPNLLNYRKINFCTELVYKQSGKSEPETGKRARFSAENNTPFLIGHIHISLGRILK